MDFLGQDIPEDQLHVHYLSAKSSQILALGLLGSAKRRDPSLGWLFETLDPPPTPSNASKLPVAQLEKPVASDLLNELPRQTAVDFLVEDDNVVLCIEAKWSEAGLGACGCASDGGDPAIAECTARVLERPRYWEAAREDLDLPSRELGKPCPISATYQAVRNVAVAIALASPDQTPAFALLYDDRNPYFKGAGDWPGWPAVLERAINADSIGRARFASASWQEIIRSLPRDEAVARWARDKHQLGS